MKEQIKVNLERLFDKNSKLIEGSSFEMIIEGLIEENPEAYDLNSGTMRSLYEKEDIKLLENAKKDKKLLALFKSAKENLIPESHQVEGIRNDILNSLETIKIKVKGENKGYENQIVFLEHDYEPFAYFSGYGKGEYPILKSPQYIKFNYQEEVFNGIGKINYGKYWKKKIEFSEQLEEMELSDIIWDSPIYQGLEDAYKFRTNLLLYEVFDQIPVEKFKGIPIKLPLFIYGNEHDCEVMNIYVYE